MDDPSEAPEVAAPEPAPAVDDNAGGVPEPAVQLNPKRALIALIIDAWMATEIYNSPVSRDTPAINHLRERLPQLVTALAQEL